NDIGRHELHQLTPPLERRRFDELVELLAPILGRLAELVEQLFALIGVCAIGTCQRDARDGRGLDGHPARREQRHQRQRAAAVQPLLFRTMPLRIIDDMHGRISYRKYAGYLGRTTGTIGIPGSSRTAIVFAFGPGVTLAMPWTWVGFVPVRLRNTKNSSPPPHSGVVSAPS